jgi:hypothetical protein
MAKPIEGIEDQTLISSGVDPEASASRNHFGLRPRPDQVSDESAGFAYFGAAGARLRFVEAPVNSARENPSFFFAPLFKAGNSFDDLSLQIAQVL